MTCLSLQVIHNDYNNHADQQIDQLDADERGEIDIPPTP